MIQYEMLKLLKKFEQKSLISHEQYNALKEDFKPHSYEESFVDWLEVRKLFFNSGVDPKFEVEPMNSANLCPRFVPVLNRIRQLHSQFNADISMQS